MACKSILQYLRLDSDIGNRINRLYKSMMKNYTNLSDINTTIDEKDIAKYEINKASKEKQYLDMQSPVYMYLENQLRKHVADVMDSINKNIMPNLDSYFEPEFITELILTYER